MVNMNTQKEIAEQIEINLDEAEPLNKKVKAGEVDSATRRTSTGTVNTFRPQRWSYL